MGNLSTSKAVLLALFMALFKNCGVWGFTSLFSHTSRLHYTPTSSRTTTNTQCTALFSSSSSTSNSQQIRRAKDVFTSIDTDGSGTISAEELTELLRVLEIEADPEEAMALFVYLDEDGDGEIGLEDFLPWYNQIAQTAYETAQSFQSLLLGRRTVDHFDPTPVNEDVLRRAIECAIAAPNRSASEPWRFIQAGPETVAKIAALKQKVQQGMETQQGIHSDWTQIPGWIIVTSKLTPSDPEVELEDFRSTACAVQNFMLSMWSEGIGTKWTSGPVQKTQEFAELCGIDTSKEKVVGCIWYGFATGGLVNADPKRRRKGVRPQSYFVMQDGWIKSAAVVSFPHQLRYLILHEVLFLRLFLILFRLMMC
jgi:nitroreductase